MAKPATLSFGKFLVLVGNGATPEVFAAPCGFTDKSLEITADTSSTDVPDCDDPDAPAWGEKNVKTLSAQVTGSGVLAQDAHKTWRDWLLSGLERNVRVQFPIPLAQGGGYYEGAAVLTSFKVSGSHGDKLKVDVTIQNASAWDWVDASA